MPCRNCCSYRCCAFRALRSPKPLDRISLEYLPCRLTTTSYRSLDRACCKSPRQLQVARHLQSELAQPLPEGRALLAALTAGAMATLAARTAWVTRREATYSAILRQALLLADHLHRRSSPSITCPPKATGSDSAANRQYVVTRAVETARRRAAEANGFQSFGNEARLSESRRWAHQTNAGRRQGGVKTTQAGGAVVGAQGAKPGSFLPLKAEASALHVRVPRRQPHWRSSAEGSSSSGAAQRNRCRRYMVKTCRLMLGNVESMRSTELRAAPRRFESAVARRPRRKCFSFAFWGLWGLLQDARLACAFGARESEYTSCVQVEERDDMILLSSGRAHSLRDDSLVHRRGVLTGYC